LAVQSTIDIPSDIVVAGRFRSLPVLCHYAGGKDRTGVISGLPLEIEEVAMEIIVEDYELIARYLMLRSFDGPEAFEQIGITAWQQYQAEYCSTEGMMKTLEHLDEKHGGVTGYIQATGISDHQTQSPFKPTRSASLIQLHKSVVDGAEEVGFWAQLVIQWCP